MDSHNNSENNKKNQGVVIIKMAKMDKMEIPLVKYLLDICNSLLGMGYLLKMLIKVMGITLLLSMEM